MVGSLRRDRNFSATLATVAAVAGSKAILILLFYESNRVRLALIFQFSLVDSVK